MPESVILAGARTPASGPLGVLGSLAAVDLAAITIQTALQRGGLEGADVDQVIVGPGLAVGADRGAARRVALKAGVPWWVPAYGTDEVGLSGLSAVAWAARRIRLGEADVVVVGGVEPADGLRCLPPGPLLPPGPAGPAGPAGLAGGVLVAGSGDRGGVLLDFDRGLRGRRRAAQAAPVPHAVPHAAPAPVPSVARLGPAAGGLGGAAAVVVMRRTKAIRLGLPWLAEITAYGMACDADGVAPSSHTPPAPHARALGRALERSSLSAADLDLVEIAPGRLAAVSGVRVLLEVAYALRRVGGGLGAAGMAGRPGAGEALLIRAAGGAARQCR
ncbi:acetyl-CoA C-acetyltransferase [Kitasatospora sp. MAA4]|uniref:thiolase family protein n=1 Tax=Kitasatospora sp. MAA4 TaxID=3035093 RepID=UPI0024749E0B|nr:hypothetical protein [Kitasatospora sp. MAA4]MDH6131843.1 acetyl-CoA C-acetyltransferase [Kitasatospora sp. MAA4]